MLAMKPTRVLFDLDGTLLDTVSDLADSVNAALKRLGRPVHKVELYKEFVGDGIGALVDRAFGPGLSAADKAAALSAVREEYSRRWKDKTRPYPGVAELLDALAARGLACGILSNKPEPMTRLAAAELLGRWKFSVVIGARPGVPLKPDPQGALEAARDMDASPGEFLYVGDTGTDMRTATAAGMRPIGVLWGFRGREELLREGAEILLSRPEELLALL